MLKNPHCLFWFATTAQALCVVVRRSKGPHETEVRPSSAAIVVVYVLLSKDLSINMVDNNLELPPRCEFDALQYSAVHGNTTMVLSTLAY